MQFVSYINLGAGGPAPVAEDPAEDPAEALAAQRAAVAAYLAACRGRLIAETRESRVDDVEPAWTALHEAFALCRQHGAALLVAKLGPMSGDRGFLTALCRERERHGLRFFAADMPEANAGTLGILTALTALEAPPPESEDRRARKRNFLTGLEARLHPRRRRGVGAGRAECPAPVRGGRPVGEPPCLPRTLERALGVAPVLAEIRAAGATTFEQIAHALNELGVPSARGDRWYPSQVRRVEKRIASAG